MALELITLVIYDITDDGLRGEVAKYLRLKGLARIQKSAFAGPLTSSARADLIAGLMKLVQGRERVNVQVYPLTEASFNQRVTIGAEVDYEEEGVVV